MSTEPSHTHTESNIAAETPTVVTTERVGDVFVIDIDDGKANALGFDVLAQVNAALDAASDRSLSDGPSAVVICGRDGKFSAGFDLKVMTGDIDGARRLLGAGAELGVRIFEFPLPVVLAVTGHALAMGGILTTCADYRVGADGSFKIGLNEVAIGMPVPGFAVELCRDRLAKRWFTRCLQHARLCSPAEAVEAGYLDEITEPTAVRDRAIEVAQEIGASVNPGAFRLTRKTMRGELVEVLRTGLAADLALFDVATP